MRKILVLVICILLASTASVAMAAVYNPPVEWTASREANHPEEWTHFIHEIPLDGTDPTGTLLDFRTPEADVKAELAALEARTGVKVATGATVTKAGLMKEDTHRTIDVTQPPYNAQIWTIDNWGSTAAEAQIGARNTRAINQALIDLSNEGGGTLYFPPGVYRTYTICLRSDVNIKLDKGAVIAAARPTTDGGATGGSVLYGYTENGTGAIVTSINNCPQPEVNLFIGFQDGGHTYFANSLIYGYGVKNVMIYGEGLVMGCYFNGAGNTVTTVVNNTDASAPAARTSRPTAVGMGKGIALDWSDNIVISGIDLFHLGHFALITGAVDNMLLENMVVDSLRDCFDIENVRNVTIRNCVMNSLQDDGLVMKATMTTGSMEHAVKNILIYNTIVAGYDMGSMLAGHPTESRPVAADQDGPTARIKLGTEGTAGYDQVTAFNVLLSRSRGVSLEQVDTNVLTNFVGYRMRMDDITSSPIYIKAGDRARYPLTGKGTSENMTPTNNERLANSFQQHGTPAGHTLPGGTQALLDKYGIYPARRYYPVYGTTSATVPTTTASGGSTTYGITIPNGNVSLNANNYFTDTSATPTRYFLYTWDDATRTYVVDYDKEISADDRGRYGIALGNFEGVGPVGTHTPPYPPYTLWPHPLYSKIKDIYLGKMYVTNINPRYSIQIHGMIDSRIEDLTLEDIYLEYRGGLTVMDSVEQRRWPGGQTRHEEYHREIANANLLWLASDNGQTTIFYPRFRFIPAAGTNPPRWEPDPYNVPEYPRIYPDINNQGITPAYGMYARHVENFKVTNFQSTYLTPDNRPAIVLDDIHNGTISGDVDLKADDGQPQVVKVDHNFKRHTSFEYFPNEPFLQTSTDVTLPAGLDVVTETLNSPEPGTPADTLYANPTIRSTTTIAGTDPYVLVTRVPPRTVYRPYLLIDRAPGGTRDKWNYDFSAQTGSTLNIQITTGNPADGSPHNTTGGFATPIPIQVTASGLPPGATFDGATRMFEWTPGADQKGRSYLVTFTGHDGLLPFSRTIEITVDGQDNVDIVSAKDAIENAVFETTQAEAPNSGQARIVTEAIVDSLVSQFGVDAIVNDIMFSAATAGTPWNPSGTDGSYTFSVTLSKGAGTTVTTIPLVLTIVATPYDPAQNDADITAVRLEIEGAIYTTTQAEVSNITQAIAKVRDIINGLNLRGVDVVIISGAFTGATAGTAGNPYGVNGSFTFSATLNKGAGTEQTTGLRTLSIIATPYDAVQDNADIAAVLAAIERSVYRTTQVDVSNAAEALAKVQSIISDLNLRGVNVVVNAGNFTAPTAGTAGNPNGVNGNFTFTATLNKGAGTSQTTSVRTLVITATPYDATQDNADIAALKADIEGAVYTGTQSNVSNSALALARVQSIINNNLNLRGVTVVVNEGAFTAAITGTSDNVNGTNGSFTFTATLSKGAGTVQTTAQRSMVITASPYDAAQNNADIAAVKTEIEGAVYTATQAEVSNVTQAMAKVRNILGGLNLRGVDVVINNGAFTAAAEGTASNPNGVNGSYTFTVTINKGAGTEQTTALCTLSIIATTYDAAQDNADITAVRAAIEGASYTASQASVSSSALALAWVQSVINGLNLRGVTVVVNEQAFTAATPGVFDNLVGIDGDFLFTATLNKGAGTEQTTNLRALVITATPYDASQDNADIAAAKAAIESAVFAATQAEAADTAQAVTKVQSIINALNLQGVAAVVNEGAFVAAAAGTYDNINGTNGSFMFTATLNKGAGTEQTTGLRTLTITPTQYIVDPNNNIAMDGMAFNLDKDASGAGWHWNAASRTLTLTGGDVDAIDITTDGDVNIDVTGNASADHITKKGAGGLNVNVADGATLNVKSDNGPAISSDGNLTLGGEGNIVAVTSDPSAPAITSGNGSVSIIDAVNVNAKANGGPAIKANTDVNIDTVGEVKAETVGGGYSIEGADIFITDGSTALAAQDDDHAFNVEPEYSGANTKVTAPSGALLYNGGKGTGGSSSSGGGGCEAGYGIAALLLVALAVVRKRK